MATILIAVALAPTEAHAALVRGKILESGTREPLVSASVHLAPSASGIAQQGCDLATTTDEEGRFSLEPSAESCLLVVALGGYERHEQLVTGPAAVVVYLDRDSNAELRTVVVSTDPPLGSAPASYSRTGEEIERSPGALSDPIRAIQDQPSIGRAPGGLGLLVVRGADPRTTAVFVDEHPIPRSTHVLGLAGTVAAPFVGLLEVQPGNFGVAYGNATGGLVKIRTQLDEGTVTHGQASLNALGASASVQTPTGAGHAGVAFRSGLADAALGIANRTADTEFLLPGYQDYQGIFSYPAGPGEVFARVLGSADRLRIGSSFQAREFSATFNRFDVGYRAVTSRWRFLLTPSFRVDTSRIGLSGGRAQRLDYVGSLRSQLTFDVSGRARLTIGADSLLERFSVEFPGNPSAPPPQSGLTASTGIYAAVDLRLGRWTFVPGARASVFTQGNSSALAVDPRLHMRWEGDHARVFAALGKYSQRDVQSTELLSGVLDRQTPYQQGFVIVPETLITFFDPKFEAPLNDAPIGLQEAIHASLGLSFDVGRVTLGTTPFARWGERRAVTLANGFSVPRRAEHTYGAEFYARRPLRDGLFGTIGYSLLWSKIHEGGITRPADFDATHNTFVVVSGELPRGWILGGRFRVASGYPYTPIIGGAYTSVRGLGESTPVYGEAASRRRPWFHQFDIRVDKIWRLQRAQLSAFADIQNVYNFVYPEVFVYSRDFSTIVGGLGLPILPSLGFRVDF